jgi:hypothetical protein
MRGALWTRSLNYLNLHLLVNETWKLIAICDLRNSCSPNFCCSLPGLDESVKIVESMGGWCRGQIVDISRREDVYKAAAEIKNNFGDVSSTVTWISFRITKRMFFACQTKVRSLISIPNLYANDTSEEWLEVCFYSILMSSVKKERFSQ